MDDLGTCDGCGAEIGSSGVMRPAGYDLTLGDDGPALPVWRFYCSHRCAMKEARR